MLPCVTAPDLAGFDWPAARPAGSIIEELLEETTRQRPSCRAATELGRPALVARPRRHSARPGQPARFDWPAGGTAAFLGRARHARKSAARAAGKPGKGTPARAPLRVWCRWRSQRQPQDRTARCPARLVATRLRQRSLRSLPPHGGQKKSRKIRVRALDRRGHLRVRRHPRPLQ